MPCVQCFLGRLLAMPDHTDMPSFFGSLDAASFSAGLFGQITWRVTELGLAELSLRAGEISMKDGGHALVEEVGEQLRAYFAGELKAFNLPLAPQGTAFQRGCWGVLQTIEFAQVISYAEQAHLLGNPLAVRAVGNANGANPIPIIIPCHRVIASDGGLGGYGPGLDIKQWLLTHELNNA